MTNEAIIKSCAELDGWEQSEPEWWRRATWPKDVGFVHTKALPYYLTSYDAIIPLIQEQDIATRTRIAVVVSVGQNKTANSYGYMMLTPSQLCEALLRATGKWTE